MAAMWIAANNGAGKRRWYVMNDDPNAPLDQRYYTSSDNRLVRYASKQAAQETADTLNRRRQQ